MERTENSSFLKRRFSCVRNCCFTNVPPQHGDDGFLSILGELIEEVEHFAAHRSFFSSLW